MKRTSWLAAVFLTFSPLGAEDLLPPVPEGMDGPPPASNEALPDLQDFDKFLPGAEPTLTDLEPGLVKPEAALQAIEKALPTATPSPAKPSVPPVVVKPAPTATSLPVKPAAVPAASEKPKASTEAPPSSAPKPSAGTASGAGTSPAVSTVADPASPVSASALTDYFPVALGMKWTYEYLKSGAAKRIRSVECTQAETFPNGTVRASFQVTEEAAVTETYSLLNGAVLRTSRAGQALEGELAFKLPKKGAPAAWTQGTRSFSASFGKAQVYQKTYPDCVVVKEKAGTVTTFLFYAKGIGLVALEVYGAGMKLDHAKSYALVSGPTK